MASATYVIDDDNFHDVIKARPLQPHEVFFTQVFFLEPLAAHDTYPRWRVREMQRATLSLCFYGSRRLPSFAARANIRDRLAKHCVLECDFFSFRHFFLCLYRVLPCLLTQCPFLSVYATPVAAVTFLFVLSFLPFSFSYPFACSSLLL